MKRLFITLVMVGMSMVGMTGKITKEEYFLAAGKFSDMYAVNTIIMTGGYTSNDMLNAMLFMSPKVKKEYLKQVMQHRADSIKADLRILQDYAKLNHLESIKVNDTNIAMARNYLINAKNDSVIALSESVSRFAASFDKYYDKTDKLVTKSGEVVVRVEKVVNRTLILVKVLCGLLILSIVFNLVFLYKAIK